MKSVKNIVELVQETINKNPKVGHLEGDFLYIPVSWSNIMSFILNFIYITYIFAFILFFTIYPQRDLFICYFIGYVVVTIILFFLFSIITYNFIVTDLNNRSFYTVSKLFNIFSIWKSFEYKSDSIKKFYLETKFVKTRKNTILYDYFGYITKNGKAVPLSEKDSPLDHDLLLERGDLLSDSLGVGFITKGDKEAFAALEKINEEYKKMSKFEKNLESIAVIFSFACLILILVLIVLIILH